MKSLLFVTLLFTHAALAYCPEESQQVALQGKLVQHTRPGAPNYESIQDGDEALTYDYLQLDAPLECEFAASDETVSEVQLIFMRNSKVTYADVAPELNKEVIITGKTMYAHAGRHFTPILLLLDDVQRVEPAVTAAQKQLMLAQFRQFQQALRDRNPAALKRYFSFPLTGDSGGLLPDSAPLDGLTEADFDQHAKAVVERLQMLSDITVYPEKQTLGEFRINALSSEEQKRRYFPAEEDGVFWYQENGQRHEVAGACDSVAGGEFIEGNLHIYQGSSANKQIPGLSESCDGASVYIFKLVGGKLKLVSSITAG